MMEHGIVLDDKLKQTSNKFKNKHKFLIESTNQNEIYKLTVLNNKANDDLSHYLLSLSNLKLKFKIYKVIYVLKGECQLESDEIKKIEDMRNQLNSVIKFVDIIFLVVDNSKNGFESKLKECKAIKNLMDKGAKLLYLENYNKVLTDKIKNGNQDVNNKEINGLNTQTYREYLQNLLKTRQILLENIFQSENYFTLHTFFEKNEIHDNFNATYLSKSSGNVYTDTTIINLYTDVHFSVRYDTIHGETMYIVGNIEKLGEWDIDKAVALKIKEFPVWGVTIKIPCNQAFEYKYVVCNMSKGYCKWEDRTNRKIKIDFQSEIFNNDNWDS